MYKRQIIRRIKSNAYEITTDYSMLGRLQWEMNEKNIIIKDIDYTEKAVSYTHLDVYKRQHDNRCFNQVSKGKGNKS